MERDRQMRPRSSVGVLADPLPDLYGNRWQVPQAPNPHTGKQFARKPSAAAVESRDHHCHGNGESGCQRGRLEFEAGEMVASHCPRADEMDAYERVLGAAIAGDSTLFAREDYVEEAWRIVEPVLKDTAVYPYAPGTWGPEEAARLSPRGGWSNPSEPKALAVTS